MASGGQTESQIYNIVVPKYPVSILGFKHLIFIAGISDIFTIIGNV